MESIAVSRLLPLKGSYDLLRVTEDFKVIFNFNEEEVRKFDIEGRKEETTARLMVTFNREASDGYLRCLDFPPILAAHISKELKGLSDTNELVPEFLTIYEKFVLPRVLIVAGNPDDLKEQEKEIEAVRKVKTKTTKKSKKIKNGS